MHVSLKLASSHWLGLQRLSVWSQTRGNEWLACLVVLPGFVMKDRKESARWGWDKMENARWSWSRETPPNRNRAEDLGFAPADRSWGKTRNVGKCPVARLCAGRHPIRLADLRGSWGSGLRLSWSQAGPGERTSLQCLA